jgi:hypothetical protein
MRGRSTRSHITGRVAVGVNVGVNVAVDVFVNGDEGVFVNVEVGASVGADIDVATRVCEGVTVSICAANRYSNLFATPLCRFPNEFQRTNQCCPDRIRLIKAKLCLK